MKSGINMREKEIDSLRRSVLGRFNRDASLGEL